MLLPKRTTISIHTGVMYFTSIYERVYQMDVIEKDEEKALISIKAFNKTPSGLIKGDSKILLIVPKRNIMC